MSRYNVLVVVVLLSCAVLFSGAFTLAQGPDAHCFHFTWLGPRYNNESVFLNATCDDATRMSSGVPCREPLVVSEDSTWPDVNYIWRHYSEHASCVLAANDICAQFTYYFNGHAENSTYMCTRAVDNLGQAITSGCYEERQGSFLTRVCFCQSVPGAIPCNNAVLSSAVSLSALFLALIMTLRAGAASLNIT